MHKMCCFGISVARHCSIDKRLSMLCFSALSHHCIQLLFDLVVD